MSHHAPTSRPKPPPPGSEEASAVLNLGEFQNVDTLTLSEASLVINALVAKRKMDRKNINETECENNQPQPAFRACRAGFFFVRLLILGAEC